MSATSHEYILRLEKADLEAFDAERRRGLRTASKVRFAILTALYLASGIVALAFGVVGLIAGSLGRSAWSLVVDGVAFIAIASVWFVVYVRGPLGGAAIGRRIAIEGSNDGLLVTAEGRLPKRYPWHRIARVSQSAAGVVLAPRGKSEIVAVPARAMGDGGDALYAFVAERIVSRRMLVARPNAFGPLPRSVDGTIPASPTRTVEI